jgi:hypothetical protein
MAYTSSALTEGHSPMNETKLTHYPDCIGKYAGHTNEMRGLTCSGLTCSQTGDTVDSLELVCCRWDTLPAGVTLGAEHLPNVH